MRCRARRRWPGGAYDFAAGFVAMDARRQPLPFESSFRAETG